MNNQNQQRMPTETKKNTAKPSEKGVFAKVISKGFGFGDADFIIKNINFFAFLALLTVVYIANGHMMDKTIRNISKTQKEIEQLKYEYKTLKSEVMYKTEEAQVLKAAEPLGLKISKEVPQRLVIANK